MNNLENLASKSNPRYKGPVLKFLREDLYNKDNFKTIKEEIQLKTTGKSKDAAYIATMNEFLKDVNFAEDGNIFLNKFKYLGIEDIEKITEDDLINIYETLKDDKIYKIINFYRGKGAINAYFNNLIKMRTNNFGSFLSSIDLEERDREEISLHKDEKANFYNKFSDFSYVNYNNWDAMEKEESFTYYLERKTGFFGSGFLGNNTNKLFYYIKANNDDYGSYNVSNSLKRKYPELSNEEIFDIFYKECSDWINTPLSEVDSFNFDLLIGANMISSKLYNLFSKTPTLNVNSISYAKSLSKLFPKVKYSNIPIVFARNLEEYLYDNYPELKGLNKNTISELLWEYKELSMEDNENNQGVSMEKLFESHNIIYAGAPGTGKSHMIDEDLSDVDEFVTRVTFYPDYEYHDFVGSILPKLDGDKVKYEFNPGPFTSILKSAINKSNDNHYLVIEEMSRGNCASIFGDIFQLLDRDEEGNSKYGINNELIAKELDIKGKVKLPSNLYILGTVNTSDQNVFVMDTAFKRRFDFKYLSVEDKQEEIGDIKFLDVYWKDFYLKLNEFIIDNLNISEDKQLGPFFINKDDQNTKVIMYLYEDIIGTYRNNKDLFNDNIKTLTNALRVTTIKELFSEEFIKFYNGNINED